MHPPPVTTAGTPEDDQSSEDTAATAAQPAAAEQPAGPDSPRGSPAPRPMIPVAQLAAHPGNVRR